MMVYEYDPTSKRFTQAVNVGDMTLEDALALSPAFVGIPPPDEGAAWDGERWIAGARRVEDAEVVDETPVYGMETMRTTTPDIDELAQRVAELEAQVEKLRADQEV